MATNSFEMQSTECPICHENYNEPKILPCAHLLCRDCLVSWMKKKIDALCPLCQSAIVDPQDSGAQNTDDLVDSLPTDHTMTALIESANILSQKHACYLHRSVDASSLCLQCSVKLCQNCIEGHKSLPVTSFHKLEDLSTLTLEGLTTTRHEPCSDHPGKTLELFCTLHNVLICHVCATSKHRPCPEVIDQQEMFEKYKQTLSEMEDELNVSISTFTQIMTKIQEHQVKSEKNTKMALEHIDITCNGLLNSVEACRKRLKTLVQEADDKIKATAIEQKSSLGDRRGRLTANLNLIQRVLQVASCSSLVTMVPKLKHRITKLDLDAALPEDARQGFKIMTLTIDREALVRVERELRNIGDIVISSVSVQDKRIPLTTVQAGSATHLNRANRQFAAGSGDLCCNQIPMQITGATSPGIGFVTDFVTKSGIKISVYRADITQLTVDAIVNGANENLLHGGGVAFAIAKAAGPDLEVEGDEYIRKFGPLKVSEVVKTTAGRLPCIAVLHAVGPRWDDYQNKEECKQALQQTVYNCLRKSHDLNYTSLAVTSISSAIFGVPKVVCADSYLAALQSFENQYGRNTSLQHIHFVDISEEMICIIQVIFKEKWDTPVLPNYVQQSFKGGLKLKSGDGIASESSLVTLGKTEKEPAYQYNFSHLNIIVKQQHISETDADVIVLWQEPGKPFEDTTSQQVLKATGKQLWAKEMAILKHKLVSGQIEMLTSNNQLIVLPVMTSSFMNTKDVFSLMEKVFNMIDIAKGKSVAISSLPYLTRQKESNSSSKDLEEFTAGLCMAVLNYVKKSDGPVNCIYIYAENVEVFRVMVHVINVKIREFESSSRLLNEAGIKQSYSDPINKILPTCKICLDEIVNFKTLSCGHTFCEKCINRWLSIQKVCPCCKSAQGLLTGNQPVDGKMEIKRQPFSLKGFDSKDCFKIVYSFPPGKQSEEHPNPGKHYSGTKREAYIPNTAEGRKVLMLLKVAFDRRLVFTVGTSATSGCNDTIIWNGIHHKTNTGGGIEYHGYPDDTYLTRVQQELKDMGVTVKDLSEEQKDFIQHPRQVYK